MKQAKLENMTVDQLVDRFVEIGVAQDQAELMGEIGKFNRLYRQMDATEKELRRRGRNARLALLRLYDHPNMQVRLNAAKRTLGVAPDAARRVLQAISDSKWQPQAMDAGMSLWNLDRGVFKPD
ncbi:hypothetical protein CU048_04580 [Beijerinckiaceae bacterium]|nr:hypothetical protein CU048_04580 [Beijerinckiaceae bacterium]